MMNVRYEKDSMGRVEIEASRYWGAQTQRAVQNFGIGSQRFPAEMIHAMALVKYAAARANCECGVLADTTADAVQRAAREVMEGALDAHFPLVIWQSGSGTQFNMNVNEVIANRAAELLGGTKGERALVHPNDHVNRGQSTNDTFPTAMRIGVARAIARRLIPSLQHCIDVLGQKKEAFNEVIKCGRTHLQDAVPVSLGQQFSGYLAQLESAMQSLECVQKELYALPVGGTAVGTGLNAAPGFADAAVTAIAAETGMPFHCIDNRFAAMAAHDEMVRCSGACTACAGALRKIATDIVWLSSGPRSGLGEMRIPSNEPGSSIMPGKVNPTQCEATLMVCTQVMGNDTVVTIAGSGGNFELNVYKPCIVYNVLQSVQLLSDALMSFTDRCLAGLEPVRERIDENVRRSLMLVTALTGEIGYDRAARIAHHAYAHNLTLREAALSLGEISAQRFDELVEPSRMV